MKSRTILSLSAIPLLRLLIPFTGGVLLFHAFPSSITYLLPGILSVIAFLLFIIFRKKDSRGRTCSYALFLSCGAFALGAINISLRSVYADPSFQMTAYWKGIVKAIPAENDSTFQCDIRLLTSEPLIKPEFYGKKARISIRKAYQKRCISGDTIVFYATLQTPRTQGNPGEFNYTQWLQRKQIFYTGKVDSLCWQSSEPDKYSLQTILAIYRTKAKNTIHLLTGETQKAHIISALLLGDKTELPTEAKEMFRLNGISHLLAVSGFHVGMIFSFIMFLFLFIPAKYKGIKYIRLIAIFILWIYAFLVGATPSVLRASLMITLFVAGNLLKRKNYAFNTLTFAALILLIADPFSLWDIGFQLSFSAVAGILCAQYLMTDHIRYQNSITRKAVSFLIVCLSAQIATLPLTLYYFGAFSPYFLAGNIIAIPFVYLILTVFGILSVLYITTGIIATPLQQALSYIMTIFQDLLTSVASLPHASLNIPVFSIERIALFYTGLCLFIIYFCYKRRIIMIASYSCIILLILPFDKWSTQRHPHLVILNNKPGNTVYLNDRKQCHIWSKTYRKEEFENAGKYYRTKAIRHSVFESAICINNLRILYLDTDSLRYSKPSDTLSVDLLVLKRGCKGDLTNINLQFKPKTILFDGSLSAYWYKKWKTEADSLSIPYYDMKEKGAFSYFFH